MKQDKADRDDRSGVSEDGPDVIEPAAQGGEGDSNIGSASRQESDDGSDAVEESERADGPEERGGDALGSTGGGGFRTDGRSRIRRMRDAFVGFVGLVALYTVLACAALFPVPLEMRTRIVGGGELGGWLWRYWLMKLEIDALRVELAGRPFEFIKQVISLGRFPETGNIADLYLISLPLEHLFGHPAYYNIKCLLILVLNALAGYALARHFTSRRLIAFTGGLIAGFNSFVFLELYESGLRQAILWWMILALLFLERVISRGRVRDMILGGVTAGLTAGFYWFYALFLGMFGIVRVLVALPGMVKARRWRSLWGLGVTAVVGLSIAYGFAYPYLYIQTDHTGNLPEVQWFAPFPSLDELENAPRFPHTQAENLLSSLARTLVSSWSLDYLWNPLHPRAVPIVLTLIAVGGALVRFRRDGLWLLAALFFWLHTGGPYLQEGFHAGQRTFVRVDGAPVRLPYAYTFQYIPLMSRLFAPYRSGGMLWILLTILAVRNLDALGGRLRGRPGLHRAALGVFITLYLGQYFLDQEIVEWARAEDIGLSGRGLPVESSVLKVHPFYERLAREPGEIGVIEVPLFVQQDLVNYYQSRHEKKLFKGWAVPGVLPPPLRFKHHATEPEIRRLMWLVEPDYPMRNTFSEALERLNRTPYLLGDYDPDDRDALGRRGFKYLILHERGCYLVWPERGADLYEALRRRLSRHLGTFQEYIELMTPTDPAFGSIESGVLGEWASSNIPGEKHPTRFRMSVYRMPGYEEGDGGTGE